MVIADDSPALGPICCCPSDLLDDGRYDPECLTHAHFRCQALGCDYQAVNGHLCCLHDERGVA